MDTATWVQILDEVLPVTSCKYIWEKYESNHCTSSYGQIVGQTVIFNLNIATDLGEGKLEIQTVSQTTLIAFPP